jgi:hypothetical protein
MCRAVGAEQRTVGRIWCGACGTSGRSGSRRSGAAPPRAAGLPPPRPQRPMGMSPPCGRGSGNWSTRTGTHRVGGSAFAERMLAVTDTCRQQGRSPLTYLSAAAKALRAGTPAPTLVPDAPGEAAPQPAAAGLQIATAAPETPAAAVETPAPPRAPQPRRATVVPPAADGAGVTAAAEALRAGTSPLPPVPDGPGETAPVAARLRSALGPWTSAPCGRSPCAPRSRTGDSLPPPSSHSGSPRPERHAAAAAARVRRLPPRSEQPPAACSYLGSHPRSRPAAESRALHSPLRLV